MLEIAEDRAEIGFDDYKEPYDVRQAVAEANRCLYCEDAPCINACPTSIDIPNFIRKIATGNIWGSAKTIFDSNILGMSCARVCPVEVLCVGDCVYNLMETPPIQIGKLQRYATDMAFEKGWEYYEAGEDTGKSVGLVGAGPASLACAHELRRFGHSVTIYERDEVLGGLNTTGVAPYKMKSDRSVEEVEWILGIGGIVVKTGVTIGRDIPWKELEDKHDAVFLGMGLGPDKFLNLDGEGLEGVEGAVDWIREMKLEPLDMSDVNHAVVLGGGNTALDCVRELRGLGVDHVLMVYRGDEDSMSGYHHEWDAAKVEGATAVWRAIPTGFKGDGKLTAVTCQLVDENKQPIEGETFDIKADLALLAVGQSKLGDQLADLDGIEVKWGTIIVDPRDQSTGREGWFAGGDGSNGAKEVVNAADEGKRAAHSIEHYLMGARDA